MPAASTVVMSSARQWKQEVKISKDGKEGDA